MLETKFGPSAQDGDYVLVVDFNYMKRKCETYVARVYRGKAYTGMRVPGTANYVHKMKAECIIPENYVSQEVKRKIYEKFTKIWPFITEVQLSMMQKGEYYG